MQETTLLPLDCGLLSKSVVAPDSLLSFAVTVVAERSNEQRLFSANDDPLLRLVVRRRKHCVPQSKYLVPVADPALWHRQAVSTQPAYRQEHQYFLKVSTNLCQNHPRYVERRWI